MKRRAKDLTIVVAPNALKGSLSAAAAAAAIAQGVRAVAPRARIVKIPVADGGDGLLEALAGVLAGRWRSRIVAGPRFKPVKARYLSFPRQRAAVIEMARASGLALLAPESRDPTLTTTLGTGELVVAALEAGARHIVVGLGGSATTDGGIGLAHALGVRFLDENGRFLEPIGGNLGRIRRIDASGLRPTARSARFEAICDVDNPLLGKRGAARVFGPQKGATPEQVRSLEAGLANLARVVERDLGKDVRHLPGAGAAGGLGAGLYAFLDARLRPGVDVVLDLLDFDDKLAGADLVLTAEGALDTQTAGGKAPAGVARRAQAQGLPCFALAGSVPDERRSLRSLGMTAVFSLCDRPLALAEAVRDAARLLTRAAEEAVRAFMAGLTVSTAQADFAAPGPQRRSQGHC